jgi:hypothetical protein
VELPRTAGAAAAHMAYATAAKAAAEAARTWPPLNPGR